LTDGPAIASRLTPTSRYPRPRGRCGTGGGILRDVDRPLRV